MTKIKENIIEISWWLMDYVRDHDIPELSSDELKQWVVDAAGKYETLYRETDWCEHSYIDEITRFAAEEFQKYLASCMG